MASSTGGPTLVDLPTEILVAIMHQLDISDLHACRQVCRRVRMVVDSTSEIQYKIHLTAYGAIDGAPGGPAIADRLESLVAHRRAWQLDSVLVPDLTFSSYDSADAYNLPEDLDFDGPLVAFQVGSEVRLSQPRSLTRCAQANEWSIDTEEVGILLQDGASDPSQGVLAISGWDTTTFRFCVHVFLLRPDGGVIPHPLASSSVFLVPESVDVSVTATRGLRICGDVVACTLMDRVYVYNWKTGNIVLNLALQRGICHLLDEGVLFTGMGNQLFAYEFNPHSPSHTEQVDPPRSCIIRLPIQPYNSSVSRMLSEAPRVAADYRGAFQDNPAHALVAIAFDLPDDSSPELRRVLCMPRTTLLSRLSSAAARLTPEGLLWEEWALANAIVLRYKSFDLASGVKVSIHTAGSRMMVALVPLFNSAHERTGPITIDIFVFHVHPMAGRTHVERVETERNLSKASPYFKVVPASALAPIPMRVPGEETHALPYAVYHKSVQIDAAESATIAGPRGIGQWLTKICEDGIMVMGERGIRTDGGSLMHRVAHSWTFSA